MNKDQPAIIVDARSETRRSLLILPNLSKYFDLGTRFFALSAPIASVLGFLVFVRYCIEIRYFPELTLSASAGLFGAIFSIGIIVTLLFFIPYSLPWFTFTDRLKHWEDYRREGSALRLQIVLATVLPSCLPCFSFTLLASAPKRWQNSGNVVVYGTFVLVVLLGFFLPIIVESNWLNTTLHKLRKRSRSAPLPGALKWPLAAYGGIWAAVCFVVSSAALLVGGRTGMWVAAVMIFLLLSIGLRGAFACDLHDHWILGFVVLSLSLWSMFISPVFPTGIVRVLGLGAYNDADVIIEKRYSEALQTQGIPVLADVDAKKKLEAKRQPGSTLTYLQGLNNNTILLRNVRVLLRVGGQVALSENVASSRGKEIADGSILLVPTTQVLGIRESRHCKP